MPKVEILDVIMNPSDNMFKSFGFKEVIVGIEK